jgi:hypothetical protein
LHAVRASESRRLQIPGAGRGDYRPKKPKNTLKKSPVAQERRDFLTKSLAKAACIAAGPAALWPTAKRP